MAKPTFVKKARKDYPDSGICKGDSYWHWSFMSGGRGGPVIRSKTEPRPSQLTRSEFWSTVHGWRESAAKESPSLEDLENSIENVKAEVEDLRDAQEEKKNAMPDGLQEGPIGVMLQERCEALDALISSLEGIQIPDESEDEGDAAELAWSEVQSALDEVSCD